MEKQPAFNCTEHKGTKDLVTLLNDAITDYIQEKIQVSRKESKIREVREVNIKKCQ